MLTMRLRTRARLLVDRVAAPYVATIVGELRREQQTDSTSSLTTDGAPNPGGGRPDSGVPSNWFHQLNHELRTMELERLRGTARRVVSVGASGRWYFDWFESCVGPLDLHIGVEAFEPEPLDLPRNAQWVQSTADRFDGIADQSVDLVFAGQTCEHLWADELLGFLLESHRVLQSGGRLVLDCPNRLVTERLRWSHGGHTVELSSGEIAELLECAGFRVESIRGIWRCCFGDEVMDLESGSELGSVVVRRIATAADRPDDSFIWWIVARPNGSPDGDALMRHIDALFAKHWPTRICRGMWPGPGHHSTRLDPAASTTIRSLPVYLRAGTTTFTMRLSSGHIPDLGDWHVTLTGPGGEVLGDARPVAESTGTAATWAFELPQLAFAASVGIHAPELKSQVEIEMPLDVRWSPGR
jgi:SAM-dependent methyltransferase